MPQNTRQPINHGTIGGYKAHKRHGEPMCEPCREANREYDRRRHVDRLRSVEAERARWERALVESRLPAIYQRLVRELAHPSEVAS